MAKSLYICYFGVREPLVQTQVIPYLRELIKDGHRISLLTFEPEINTNWTSEQFDVQRREMESNGIDWHCLGYHKWPSVPATLYDILRGTLFIRRFISRHKPEILHGRVHLPTLMGALARKLSRHKPKLLFDIRGFFPEEYTDAGVWPENGWLYRAAKRIERWLFGESDGFVVLTENARNILFPESKGTGFDRLRRPVEVIPCCVDFERRFIGNSVELRNSIRQELKTTDRFVITHLGALSGLYLDNEIADFLGFAKTMIPETFALLLTQSDPRQIVALLSERGFTESDMYVDRVQPSDVQRYLESADLALSFVKAGYATASRSPTKIPEYLASGLPVIANRGVGDIDSLISDSKVGSIVNDFTPESFQDALESIRKSRDFAAHRRKTARSEFDLEKVGGVRYCRIYRNLGSN